MIYLTQIFRFSKRPSINSLITSTRENLVLMLTMPSRDRYADEHRIFLQGIMCKGVLNDKEVHALHDKALKACNIDIPEKKTEKDQLLVSNIQLINSEIKKIGLLIKKGQDEEKPFKSYFMLMNNSNRMTTGGSNSLGAGVQVQWLPQELEYLRLLATEILQSDEKAISSREALHLTDQVGKNGGKKMSMEDAEDTVNRLIMARWIKTLNGNNQLTLDVRFIGEMESWMVEVMGADNMTYCKTCHKLVVRGKVCNGCEENVAWHHYCLEKQVTRGVDVKCPVCNTLVAEGRDKRSNVQEPTQSLELPSQSQVERGEPTKRSRRRSSRDEDSDRDKSPKIVPSGGRIKRRMSMDDSDSD